MQTTQSHATLEWITGATAAAEVRQQATPAGGTKPGYYGLPLLKRPTWHWHIAWYFYLEGISAGAFLLGGLADVLGAGKLNSITRAGRYISFLSFLPCPPLLIADLGDPSRFHHMLRVFKPSSPMNLGTWVLTGYSVPLTLLAAKQVAADLPLRYWPLKVAGAMVPSRPLAVAGIPLALEMAGYTGVLLSQTSIPLWSRSRWLGALFAANAVHSGAAAASLALVLFDNPSRRVLRRMENVTIAARVGEALMLGMYLLTSRRASQPLVKGRHGWQFWVGAVGLGLLAPTLVQALTPKRRSPSIVSTILRSACSLLGAFALKWAVVQAGKASAQDVVGTQEAARPTQNSPGWRRQE